MPSKYQLGMPTRKTKQLAEYRGWDIDSAESFNTYSQRKKDMFGFIDLVALDGESIIAIQTTSTTNSSTRVKKILEECEHEAKRWIQSGGRILVITWGKPKGKRELHYQELELVIVGGELGWKEL